MKKRYYFISALVVVVGGFWGWGQYMYNTYTTRSFVTLTGITTFDVKDKIHDDHDCYIKTIIGNTDKKRMLAKYNFKPTPITVNGLLPCKHLPKNQSDYLYYLEDSGHGYLAYVLYMVSKKDNILIVYQEFGD